MSTWNAYIPLSPDEVDEVEELLGYEEDAHDDLGYEVYGDE